MPKFHLQLLPVVNINNDYKIDIDNIPYNEQESYTNVKSIEFANKYGLVRFQGLFDLSGRNIPSLVYINDLSLEVSDSFLNSCKYNFCNYKTEIFFYLSYDNMNQLKNYDIESMLKYYKPYLDYNKKILHLETNQIKNININNYLRDKQKENIFNLNEIKTNDENNMDYSDNENEQMVKNENNISEKIEEEKKNYSFSEIMPVKKEYFKMKSLPDFINNIDSMTDKYSSDKNNKFINIISNSQTKAKVHNLTKKGNDIIKKNIQKDRFNSLNLNGIYYYPDNSISKDKLNYYMQLKKIKINSNFPDNNENKNIIYFTYIDLLEKINKENKYLEVKIDLNSYTSLIINYINQLTNSINEISKNIKDNNKELNNIFIKKLQKTISTLKLFTILFLNCFMYKPENYYINDPNLFTYSYSNKVMSYRKRLLTEWCIDEQKTLLSNFSNNIPEIKQNYKKFYSFGQIKQGIDNPKKNLLLRLKLANNQDKNAKNTVNYFTDYNPLYGENNKKFKDVFVDKYNNDWVSFLIQSLLNEEDRDEYIISSIELVTKYLNDMSSNAKPVTLNENNNIIYDINFILLKLYEYYIKGDINNQIKYLKMISYSCNLTGNKSNDHFIQFIICSILQKILNIIFPQEKNLINSKTVDNNFIKKISFHLLKQVIEEILISNYSQNDLESYIHINKIISLSFLSTKNKERLINDIISKINISPSSLNLLEEENPLLLNNKQKNTILAYINNSLCDWKNAYNYYMSAKEYKFALDSCINFAISDIKQNEENTDFKEIYLRLEEIKKNSRDLFIDFYQIFYLFIKYMSDIKNNQIAKEKDICILIKEFSSNKKYLYNDLLDENVRGKIIDYLYQLLMKSSSIYGNIRSEDKNVIVGNSELIKNNYVIINTRLNMLNSSDRDNITFKNLIFQNN